MTTIDAPGFIELLNRVLPEPGTVLLDGAGGRPGSESLLFHGPDRVLQARTTADVLAVLRDVEAACKEGLHVAGFLAYEAGHAFWEERFPELRVEQALPGNVPLAWFGVYSAVTPIPSIVLEAWSAEGPESSLIPDLVPAETPARFKQRVDDIRELIHEGDVYQVNHTTRFTGHYPGKAEDLYRAVRKRQPVGYGGLLSLGTTTILSFSPELFFEQRGRRILTEPMKGTAPRGGTPQQDVQLQDWLKGDEKNRAENLMIVDLLRNDLSMVSRPGSVVVPERFAVQALPSVHQMTSRIEAELLPEADFNAIVRALFPCGSITGAPKVRAMRRIARLEAGPRGVYCGAIGYLTGSGAERRSVFSVAIRTAVLSGADLTLGAGGGIVWDSEPEEEYHEMLLKTRFFSSSPPTDDVQLIETMRAEADGTIPWRSWHLDRLRSSASTLGFSWDQDHIDAVLASAIEQAHGAEEGFRVRLLLAQNGSATATASALDAPPETPLRICLTEVRIASSHPRYCHKTTDRGPYTQASEQARAHACFDGLLINERGEVTEGAISNVFIRRGETWFTPPLESGLLPGVGRRVFLLEHAAREQVLRPEDLRGADEIRITNAIIGERVAVLVE